MITPTRTFNALLGAFAALACIAVGSFVWSTYFERPYLHYQNLPFPVLATVRAGDAVQLSVERCNSHAVKRTYDTTHTLTNLDTRRDDILPNVTVDIKPGCHRGVSKINLIPANTVPGYYLVSGVAAVDGMFVKHKIAWYSEPFEVTH